MGEVTREDMGFAIRQAIGRLSVDRVDGKLSIDEYSSELSALYEVRRELEAGGWRPFWTDPPPRNGTAVWVAWVESDGRGQVALYHATEDFERDWDDLRHLQWMPARVPAPPTASDGGEDDR